MFRLRKSGLPVTASQIAVRDDLQTVGPSLLMVMIDVAAAAHTGLRLFIASELSVNRLDRALMWSENEQAYLLFSDNQPMPQHSVRGAFG